MNIKILILKWTLFFVVFLPQVNDMGDVTSFSKKLKKTLSVPVVSEGTPSPGKRVRETPPEYAGTNVHHSLFLPQNWKKNRKYPVIVEYPGNYSPPFGCTGEVIDASLGYGLSAGKFIWVVMPFISEDGKSNEVTWWGDIAATVSYCKKNVLRICEKYNGDTSDVFICGFSRGAIAVNFIGLYDDEIAKIWRGFISHDHYDGVKEWNCTTWGSPLDFYREGARERLYRLQGRPVLVMQNGTTKEIQEYLGKMSNLAEFTFLDVPINSMFPIIPSKYIVSDHTDKWLLFNHKCTDKARKWLTEHADRKR